LLDMDYDYYFEKLVVLLFLPAMWVAAFLLAVGSSGELGCVLPDGWGCDHAWSGNKRALFFAFLFGPVWAIRTVAGIVVVLIRYSSHPNWNTKGQY
jgi:hypothetical protein